MTKTNHLIPQPSKARLKIELFLLGIVIPTIIIYFRLAPHMFMFLWGSAAICLYLYRQTEGTKHQIIWGVGEVNWVNLKPIVIRWIISTILLIGFVYLYAPDRLFEFVSERPEVWVVVMFFYPVLSALPQEFIFCTFFFARFRPLFPETRHLVWVSAIVFAYAHVLYINPVAPLLSLIGGYFFATTYVKHKSLLLISIEHALYGNTIFTVGLGYYFYGGAVAQHAVGG